MAAKNQPPVSKFAPAPDTPPAAAAPAAPQTMFVLDTTATHDAPARKHEIMLEGDVRKEFTFHAGKPTELPWEVALKFLKYDAFRLTDEDGNPVAFQGTPRQPEDLDAGERFVLADNEVVARYDELTTMALQMRCAQMPAGESVARRRNRDEMMEFIVARTLLRRAENTEREPRSADDFVPSPEPDGGEYDFGA